MLHAGAAALMAWNVQLVGTAAAVDLQGAVPCTAPQVSLLACLLLDLTIPRLDGERGKQAWQVQK